MKKVISERVETSSLIIREGMTMDIQFLNKICESWDDKRLTEGHDFEPGFIEKCINEGDLPPISDASKERYSFLGVYIQNLTGLRFWFKNGFEKIIDITKGDNNFTSCYSVVKLKKEIKYQ